MKFKQWTIASCFSSFMLPLDCPSILISSANDPWMSAPHAALWTRRWRSELIEEGRLGHINADSGLGDWRAGQQYLQRLGELAHNKLLAFSA
ncbi:RBBP9/YdeN family alpha/beta hydrolase [Massilia scottii]|uniref:RBBP9/YdeN family alpha/beta hydrolase n=1 Tax=Massilia scottii TaxID=3057166 RepID=UPI002796525C|nr:alpha/beta hydrolase [Massilia sp. CCM 9029]MDQ1830728.1 alpha/beta hydrolase [Massilia sp. CCM 9029]